MNFSEQNKRRYYSQRFGGKSSKVEFSALKEIFLSVYEGLDDKGYFYEYFGSWCPDAGTKDSWVPGKAGTDAGAYVLRKLRKNNLWPIKEKCKDYSEEDFFDVIEFLFDHISLPLEKDAYLHSYGDCGYHYKHFDSLSGQLELITQINEFLNDYGDGYELNLNGEIYTLLKEEFRPLIGASIPASDPKKVESKIKRSVDKYRRYGSTLDERKDAVRELADCLEYLRKDLQSVLTKKDDGDLFNIANNFGIRHHNDKQQTNYDHAIWLSWMFYFYLATLHAGIRLIEKNKKETK